MKKRLVILAIALIVLLTCAYAFSGGNKTVFILERNPPRNVMASP